MELNNTRITYLFDLFAFLFLFGIASKTLTICSYNVHGINNINWDYLNHLVKSHNFDLLQEHWLHNSQAHLITDHLKDVHMLCVSGMPDPEFITGRPYGGCAILWNNTMICNVEPVSCQSNRLCAVKVELQDLSILLFTLYMPCDTECDANNVLIYNDVLCEITSLATSMNIDQIICGGDFNTDVSRTNSLHTKSLLSFAEKEHLKLLYYSSDYNVDFTFESKANHVRSTIDHFLVSQNLADMVTSISCDHNIDNLSDHSVLSATFDISTQYVSVMCNNEDKLMWSSATEIDLQNYKCNLNVALLKCHLPVDALYCNDHFCVEHGNDLQMFHDAIINSCLSASKCIPHSKHKKSGIPGWTEFVGTYREKALFWHKLWKENDCPRSGFISDIRRKTRAQYHNVLKKVQRNEKDIRFSRMAGSFYESDKRNFWTEIKKVRGRNASHSTSIDGVQGEQSISDLFSQKYKNLYNSVPYNIEEMSALKASLDHDIIHHGQCEKHLINVNDVMYMVKSLKPGKHDGNKGHFSNHLISGTNRLYCYISLLFDSMISHGFVPKDFLLSTLIPIPKNRRKSLNCSDNYRAIALSSVMGKLLDKILLDKCSDVFTTSMYQYGFKKAHSTSQCTFVVNETIQYYMNNNSNVYTTLLDASRAFDRVEYVKLFRVLMSKGICPVIARFLVLLYTNQMIRVKWGSSLGFCFSVCNGVKQGGVMSPLLFTVYIDELLLRLKNSLLGCYIGAEFCGAYGYADDVILLAPTLYSLRKMLRICSEYAQDFNVLFNPTKSKLILYNTQHITALKPNINFMNVSIEVVNHDKHLGNYIGNISQDDIISHITNDFRVRVNMVKTHFKCIPTDTMYFLFKTYCMPLYGSQLWDLSSPATNKFYVAWRKSIRYLLDLPRRTHCSLLNYICDDVPISYQMCCRFQNFFKSLAQSHNTLTQLCSRLALRGSRSAVSNSLSYVSFVFKCHRNDIVNYSRNTYGTEYNMADAVTSSVIRDVLHMRHVNYNDCSQSILGNDEIDVLLSNLCTC